MSTQLNSVEFHSAPRAAQQPNPELLHELVSAHAGLRSNAAIDVEGTELSFQELDQRAGRIANFLISQGIQSGNIVAVRQAWSTDLFASLLGVLKAGAAYVTIDPIADVEDAATIVARCQAKLIIDSARLPVMAASQGVPIVIIEDVRDGLDTLSGKVGFAGRRRAFANRTSSVVCSAKAEGVASIKHRDAVRFVSSLTKLYDLDQDHRCYHDPSIAFEVAVEEGLAMLAAGASLVLDRPADASAETLVEFIADRAVTLLSVSPEIIAGVRKDMPSLKVLLLGRDVSSTDVVVRWAFRVSCVVSIRQADDRFPSFRIEQENRSAATRPALIYGQVANRHAFI